LTNVPFTRSEIANGLEKEKTKINLHTKYKKKYNNKVGSAAFWMKNIMYG
jgi:hypothetical protein